ncbi:MAG: NAD-dependent epimerase/dehydratase family protein [Reichenbachiella sp.]
MNILITGGTGFLGKATCYYLKNKGYTVTALGRNEKIGAALQSDGIAFKKIDLLELQNVIEVIKEVDMVVHCAALSSSWGSYSQFYRNNVIATENVIQACLTAKISRLVHISSPSIYSCFSDQFNIKENISLPSRSLNNYIKTKILAEEKVDAAYTQGLSVITLRPQAIFGPEDPAIFPRLIDANEKKGIPVFNRKPTVLDVTYVDNVAEAIRLALVAPVKYSGKKYNITNGSPVELLAFLENLFSSLNIQMRKKKIPYVIAYGLAFVLEKVHQFLLPNKEPILTPYSLSVLGHSRTLDITAAQTDLHYKTIVSVEEGTKRFVEWWNTTESIDGH